MILEVNNLQLEIMDQITLENNAKYIVVDIANNNSKQYYLLVNEDDINNIMIAYIDGKELVSIENRDEFKKILKCFDSEKILKTCIYKN